MTPVEMKCVYSNGQWAWAIQFREGCITSGSEQTMRDVFAVLNKELLPYVEKRCRNGHAILDGTTYQSADGVRRCRECRRGRDRLWRTKARTRYREVAAIMRCEGVQL